MTRPHRLVAKDAALSRRRSGVRIPLRAPECTENHAVIYGSEISKHFNQVSLFQIDYTTLICSSVPLAPPLPQSLLYNPHTGTQRPSPSLPLVDLLLQGK